MRPSLFDNDPRSPVVETPIEAGMMAAEACAARAAEGGWDARAAAAFVLAYLAEHGPTAGEVLVTKASEKHPCHNPRAYGAVIGRLSRSGLIEKCGHVARSKGHGTAGGLVWRLAKDEG